MVYSKNHVQIVKRKYYTVIFLLLLILKSVAYCLRYWIWKAINSTMHPKYWACLFYLFGYEKLLHAHIYVQAYVNNKDKIWLNGSSNVCSIWSWPGSHWKTYICGNYIYFNLNTKLMSQICTCPQDWYLRNLTRKLKEDYHYVFR